MNEEIRKSVMQKNEENKKRLERCKTCRCPYEGPEPDHMCPGRQGIGCIGDWRCCKEIVSVCHGCTDCGDVGYLYCENTECEKMRKFKNGEE